MKVSRSRMFIWAVVGMLALVLQDASCQNLVISTTNSLATLAGLGLLGSAGALATGYALGRRRGRGGRRYRGGWGYRYRGRRSEEVFEADDFENILDETAKVDTEDCGRKLLCVAAGLEQKSTVLQALLRPFKGEGRSNDAQAYGDYDEAVWRGSTGRSCTHYTRCQHEPQSAAKSVPQNRIWTGLLLQLYLLQTYQTFRSPVNKNMNINFRKTKRAEFDMTEKTVFM
ncbi:uncharacterized protein LOC122253485 [Penaeus japonicus]|uniref:uncharacterized protein LOC122253485 n=1 Tax=Penaeus japonicus TaxID=27405 RepID=UPI001C717A8E|nr:uncharacterized protein LOC122253485 [Penaeus japonicus]